MGKLDKSSRFTKTPSKTALRPHKRKMSLKFGRGGQKGPLSTKQKRNLRQGARLRQARRRRV